VYVLRELSRSNRNVSYVLNLFVCSAILEDVSYVRMVIFQEMEYAHNVSIIVCCVPTKLLACNVIMITS